MSAIKSLYLVSKQLYDFLQEPVKQENRDMVIQKIEGLLESRQNLIDQIISPYSPEEKLLGAEVIKLNKVIDEKLAQLKQEIQLDLNQLKKTKTSTNKYTNPYDSVSSDGMFFDKRK